MDANIGVEDESSEVDASAESSSPFKKAHQKKKLPKFQEFKEVNDRRMPSLKMGLLFKSTKFSKTLSE